MTRSDSTKDDAFLDALFAEERDANATPSPDFLARVLEDAETVQAGFGAPEHVPAAPRPGLLSQLLAALGGWPAVAGLAAASVCGVWLGVSPPQGLSDTASLYFESGTDLLDPVSGFDFTLSEG